MKIIQIILIMFVFTSCATKFINSDGVKKVSDKVEKYVITEDNKLKYLTNKEFLEVESDSLKEIPIKKGQKLRYYKHYEYENITSDWLGIRIRNITEAFQIENNNDTIWAFTPSVIDEKVRELIDNNYEIIVKNEESSAAWSRTIAFVNENSKLRIKTQTENLIATELGVSECGYTVIRYINGNNTVIKFESKISAYCEDFVAKMRKAIYFIKYGIKE